MNGKESLVSVIIRTKDRPRFLKNALRSISAQDYRPVEVVLINDGGCALDTYKIANILTDVPYTYIFHEQSKGRSAAGNAGILNARGDFIGFLDDDDEFFHDHVSSLVSALEGDEYKVAYSDSELVLKDMDSATGKDEVREKKIFSSYDFSYVDLVVGNYIPLISVLFSGNLLRESGGFDESFDLYEDWDLLLRISKNHPFRHVSRVTSRYYQWNKRLQVAQSADQHMIEKAFSQIINKHHEKITPEVILNLKKKQEVLTDELQELIDRHTKLDRVLSQKEIQLLRTKAVLAEKNDELFQRRAEIFQKEKELSENASKISGLKEEVSFFKASVEEMKSTLGWRLLDKVRVARDKMLPADTARAKYYRKMVNRIKGVKNGPFPGVKEVADEKETFHESIPTETISENSGAVIAPESVSSSFESDVSETPVEKDTGSYEPENYEAWFVENEPGEADLLWQKSESEKFLHKPLISIIVPVFETDRDMLIEMIESVRAQTYENWQLCIAEGNSSKPYIREIIQEYVDKDSRITAKFLDENKFISGNSNEALSLAEGEFVGFLDHDDELAPFALFEIVRFLNDDSAIDLIYSDEDRIDVHGKRSLPFFKPDWSPDLLLCVNYICHFAVLRLELLRELGGFRVQYDGAQDYDLFLRASKKTSRIAHIPKILYHWREHERSTLGDDSRKDIADLSGKAVLNDYFQSHGIDAAVVPGFAKTNYLVKYAIQGSPSVSIIIPFKDKIELLRKCVDSILEKTTYRGYELILVSNMSTEEETTDYLDSLIEHENVRILKFEEEFNFSRINNYAVRESHGEHLLFLNNDTEVIEGDWLTCLVEQSQRIEIGAVGCKLLFPDGRIQHAGVVIGMTGFAGHVFAGLPEHYYSYYGFTDFVRNVMAVTGACMMIKRELFEKAGGLNESFTVCGSDVDLCLRIHEMGVRNIYIPHVVLYHHESASRGSFIPPDDFELSLKRYKRFLDRRDPYYNPNLTLLYTDCSLKAKNEEEILRDIRENAIKQSKEADETRAEETKHLKTTETIHLVEALDFTARDLDICRQRMIDFEKNRQDIKSINWFIPYFYHVYYGGIYTILRFADYFSRQGMKNRFVLYDSPAISENDIFEKIQTAFPRMHDFEVYVRKDPDINVIPYADISIATLWTSAFRLLKFEKTRGKFYFIQDYEPLFYPAGTQYALAEATYRFGFYGIINTPGLYHYITDKYDMTAEYFVPAVDHHIFSPMEQSLRRERKQLKLFFYGRPQHDRNAFALALAAAKKIKAILGMKIKIVSAGSEWKPSDYGVAGIVENLGLLGYRETAELYRTSDFGLILMFTKHPSYLPLELMASGSIVITNYNEATSWLLRDGINCICVEPSPSYITEKLLALISDPELQNILRVNAAKKAASFTWEREMGKVYRFITGTEMIADFAAESRDEGTGASVCGEDSHDTAAQSDTRTMQALLKTRSQDFIRIEHQLRRKDQRIDDLELSLQKKENILNNIYGSHGWKALSVYYKLRDNVLPVGSRRRRAVKSAWKLLSIANPKHIRLLTRDNISRAVPYIKTYGMRTFVNKFWDKLNAESAVGFKKPNVPVLNLATIEDDTVLPHENATVSVIIPTKNAGDNFDLLLSMLREQRGVKDVEIIIVDSGSSDDTLNTAKAFGARIIEMPPEKFSHSNSRNAGADISTGNHVFFTVQDALPPSKLFFHELLKVLTTNDVAAVSCAEFPREDVDLFYSVLLWNHYKFLEVDKHDRILTVPDLETHINLRKNGQLSDLACILPRDLFMKYKYRFDYAEDLDLGIRLIRDGHKIAFLSSIPVIHSHNRSPFYFLKRGYVDNVFLTDIFPDYSLPSLQEAHFLKDIFQTYHLLQEFIVKDLGYLKPPIRVDALFYMADRKLGGSLQHRHVSSSFTGRAACRYVDEGLQSFLRQLSEVSRVREEGRSFSSYDGILITGVMNHLSIVKEYMSLTYDVVDDVVLEDFKALIIKIFALQCGAHLAYCYLNGGSILKEFHARLKGGI